MDDTKAEIWLLESRSDGYIYDAKVLRGTEKDVKDFVEVYKKRFSGYSLYNCKVIDVYKNTVETYKHTLDLIEAEKQIQAKSIERMQTLTKELDEIL